VHSDRPALGLLISWREGDTRLQLSSYKLKEYEVGHLKEEGLGPAPEASSTNSFLDSVGHGRTAFQTE
jgi:hypothetical protein